MRPLRLLLVLLLAAVSPAAGAQEFRVPTLARVVDQANVLRPQTREQLARLLEAHERKSSDQLVVVTLASLGGRDIAEIGLLLGRAWKLGTKQNSNGALLIVAPKDRQVRIEVGYGLEGSLPDARAFQIVQREILPRFRAGDLDAGVLAGAAAIIAAIEGTYVAPPASDGRAAAYVPVAMLFVFAVLMFLRWRYGGGLAGGPRMAGRRWGYGAPPIVFGPPGGFGGGSRGGLGGGFSGGGGSFGGGGASGRW